MPEDRQGASKPALFAGDARFRPLAFVGRGSLGSVYRALDEKSGSVVALKTILAAEPDWIDRLKREFRSVQGVVHRNLVQLYDLVVGEDACFFTMEFVEGQDFVSHVRGDKREAPFVEVIDRFRLAAPQLAAGVSALHAAGHVHRDIKPGNLKVDTEGRVVLLDFDLVAPVAHHLPMDFASAGVAGTFAYMAPEQMIGEKIGPAADWYAVGGVLYESLTGELPTAELYHRRIVPLLDRAPEVPAWLAALIEALLSNDPDARPTGEEILRCLDRECAPEAPGTGVRAEEPRVELVGRARDLAQLESTYREGGVAVIGIHGSSGVGKSELVRTFLAGLAASAGEAAPVILAGRCNPQESIRYKALDAIVDALSRHLRDTGESLPNLEPGRAAALTRLFPVLARVPGLAEAARKGTVPDVLEARWPTARG
jgi:hypothetical protein